jgi:hypothetical protein
MISPAPDPSTTLVLRRTFTASQERVFRAWIEPKAFGQQINPTACPGLKACLLFQGATSGRPYLLC